MVDAQLTAPTEKHCNHRVKISTQGATFSALCLVAVCVAVGNSNGVESHGANKHQAEVGHGIYELICGPMALQKNRPECRGIPYR